MGAVAADAAEMPGRKRGRRSLLLLGIPVVLAAIGAGLWFGGVRPPWLGLGGHPGPATDAAAPPPPVFMELPEMVANLNAGPHRASYIKLRPRLELARASDEAAVKAAMPRLLDLFQTYLRAMRPEELRGSAGTYRLREELLARANVAVAPARIVDVLFPEMLVQ